MNEIRLTETHSFFDGRPGQTRTHTKRLSDEQLDPHTEDPDERGQPSSALAQYWQPAAMFGAGVAVTATTFLFVRHFWGRDATQ